jgi:uncharacterized LabA/DUF88 family protein
MCFIDGTWAWHNMMTYKQRTGHKIDLGSLPTVVTQSLGDTYQLHQTILCASSPTNVNLLDNWAVEKRNYFFDLLRTKYSFMVDIYSIDFRGQRLRKSDRSSDSIEPKEKCVDIAVVANLFYYASEYDIALVVTGDKDFLPAFDKLVQLGKRVVIVSFKQSCSAKLQQYEHPNYRVIWIDDLASQLYLSDNSKN